MSNLTEIKQRMARLSELSSEMQGQLKKLRGPEGLELREQVKEQGKKIGVGAGIATAGVFVLIGGALYIIALLIILFDLFMPLWAAALTIVLGALFLGGSLLAIGIGIARKAAKDIPKVGGGVIQSMKTTSDEMKSTLEEMQVAAKQEAAERGKQAKSMMQTMKPAIPFIIGAFVAYKILKRKARDKKTRRIILEEWEED